MRTAWFMPALGSILVAVTPHSPPAALAPRAGSTLSGVWRFNPDQSEDAVAKLRSAMEEQMGRDGPMKRPRGTAGEGEAAGTDARRTSLLHRLPAPAMEVAITQTELEVTILEKDGRLRRLIPDGKRHKKKGGEATTTEWRGTQLKVWTETDDGPGATEALSTSPDGKQLTIVYEIETSFGRSVSVKRVYDRAPPPGSEFR
jgi:hypothetical protein